MVDLVDTVVLASGGLDSTVLLAQLQAEGHVVHALALTYGQRNAEGEAAARAALAPALRVPAWDAVALPDVFAGSSLLAASAADVPSAHYAHPSQAATVVPCRNLVLIALAAAFAASRGARRVACGIQGGAGSLYPDCRPAFVDAAAAAVVYASGGAVVLDCRLGLASKADIIRAGARLGVPLGATWSCYRGGRVQCGVCGACVKRREGFAVAGVDDPTAYLPPRTTTQ